MIKYFIHHSYSAFSSKAVIKYISSSLHLIVVFAITPPVTELIGLSFSFLPLLGLIGVLSHAFDGLDAWTFVFLFNDDLFS